MVEEHGSASLVLLVICLKMRVQDSTAVDLLVLTGVTAPYLLISVKLLALASTRTMDHARITLTKEELHDALRREETWSIS